MPKKDEVLPLRKEEPKKEKKQEEEFSLLHQEEEGRAALHRRFIPITVSTVGRSIKLRDKFILSGVVASDSTVVSVTADGSSGNETDLKSFKFFANEWHVGMVVRITASGVITDDGTRTCTLRIGSGLAATTEWNSMTSTAATVTNAPWHLTWTGIVTTIGSSGTLEAQMNGKINNVNKDDANTAAVALNTQSSITIALTADWSANTANNSISVRQWLVEVLN